MRLSQAWIVAGKEFSIFRRRPSILISLVAFPAGIGLGLPSLLWWAVVRSGAKYSDLIPLFNSFLFFFIIGVVALSASMAAYSIVGEKTTKSLEPLLATPTSDTEILLGKTLAAFLPTIGSTYVGATIYMGYVDGISHTELGYFFYPNWTMAVFLFVLSPLACFLTVELNVLFSARVSDVRTATQLGGILVIPFMALYVAGEINAISLDTPTFLEMSLILLVLDLLLLSASRATFRREEILTRWK